MDIMKLMQGSIVLAIIFLMIAFLCWFEEISAGMFFFMLAFALGILVIILLLLPYRRNTLGEPSKKLSTHQQSQSEALTNLKIRYVKGEITTEQFQQLKKDLAKQV